ncbi:MAG: hypothetical protein EGQ29_03135 [Clostridiales bacterium]|mgnify:FL=1|nr:hypothetical protein [Clostridiales bacterium]
MKKIIATVLAMVMALALCTVAFAATTTVTEVTGTDYSKVEDGDSTDGITITAHYKLTADSAADYDVYVKSGDTFKMVDEVTATKYREGFKTINLALYANAKAATCSDDGYKVTVYQSANATYFAKVADVDAYNDANATSKITDTTTKVFIGTKFDDAVAYYQFTSKDSAKVAGGHALYKTSEVWGKNDATVYACAICGGKYVIKSNVNANDAVESLAKISYGPINAGDVKSVLNGKGIDVTKAFEPTAATVMYTLTAGSTTGTTNTTKPSPKTFDAGIAMYVGMALTSVAGSAVVIGKKKEF